MKPCESRLKLTFSSVKYINAKNKDGDVSQNQIIKSFQKINQVWDELFVTEQARIISLLVRDVIINPDGVSINIYKQGLNSLNNEFL